MWGSGPGPFIGIAAHSYPLKTSLKLKYGQEFGGVPCAVRAGFQVASFYCVHVGFVAFRGLADSVLAGGVVGRLIWWVLRAVVVREGRRSR